MNSEYASTLLTVVQIIEKICRAHVAIADFDYGDLQVFNNTSYRYPLCYLETVEDLQENRNGSTHTYTIALNLVDRRPAGVESHGPEALVLLQDRLTQLFFELKNCMQLDLFFGKERVSAADLLLFNDFADAEALRLRAEFQVEVDTVDNDYPDLQELFPTLL